MENERKLLSAFIDAYKLLPSLWEMRSKDYSNRIRKNADYDLLLESYKKMHPEGTKERMMKKINSMRTSYRRELKKLRKSEKSGASGENVYEPTIWYFDQLGFLEDQIEQTRGVCTMVEENEDTIEELVSRQKKRKMSNEDKVIQLVCEKLSKRKETSVGNTMSKSWGSQFDQLETSQQVIASRLISDVLFHGSFGSLQKGHVAQVHNIFNGQHPPTPDYVPQHQVMVPLHHVLKSTSNTSTPTPTSLTSRTPHHSAQPQSPFVAYEQSDETLISAATMSEQCVDNGEDFDLSKIKDELDIEEHYITQITKSIR